jgi:lipoprotein-anchoring transpeptidase ErfK/SrfK
VCGAPGSGGRGDRWPADGLTLNRAIAALFAVALMAVSTGTGTAAAQVDEAPPEPESAEEDVQLPAAAVSRVRRVEVRAAPAADARVIERMRELRRDHRPTIFELVARERDSAGIAWFQILVPGRPNGRRGWVPAESLDVLYSVADRRIEVDRSRRRFRLVASGRTLIKGPIAVGTRDAPTPLGTFYLAAEFRPGHNFLGPYAFETSAYSALSDWPGGGIVGLHGTSEPQSVGKRASHGCLRVFNRTILRIRKHVRLGTPLIISR